MNLQCIIPDMVSWTRNVGMYPIGIQIPAGALLPWFEYVYAQMGNGALPWNMEKEDLPKIACSYFG
jgi:hypothetical protein